MRRRLRDAIELIAYRRHVAHVLTVRGAHEHRFQSSPDSAIASAGSSMKIGALAKAQEGLQRSENGRAHARHPDDDSQFGRHGSRHQR
jgi:hypothetical protein